MVEGSSSNLKKETKRRAEVERMRQRCSSELG